MSDVSVAESLSQDLAEVNRREREAAVRRELVGRFISEETYEMLRRVFWETFTDEELREMRRRSLELWPDLEERILKGEAQRAAANLIPFDRERRKSDL